MGFTFTAAPPCVPVGPRCRGRRRSLRARRPGKAALNLAMVGEPQTLDPMASTADLVGTIMQHVYELLYTFDAKWNVVPMLAETLPTVSADGKATPSRCARA